jgi:hypothetical protein
MLIHAGLKLDKLHCEFDFSLPPMPRRGAGIHIRVSKVVADHNDLQTQSRYIEMSKLRANTSN